MSRSPLARRFREGALALLAGLTALLPAAPAAAQLDRYEAQYGQPIDVKLSDLAMGAVSYEGRAIRTKGRLDFPTSGSLGSGIYTIRELSVVVSVYPVRDLQTGWDQEARELLGQEVEFTGLFSGTQPSSAAATRDQTQGVLQFWRYEGPPERPQKDALAKLEPISIEQLVSNPRRQEGRTVKVVGMFRGKNLYGDLPVRSQLDSRDWVIKDDVFSIWVTGRKPKGDGFELDISLKRDTGKWLQVVGRVETKGDRVYLRASHVSLSSAPTPTAAVQAPPPPPERPKQPPVVVFSLPLDGEREVPPDSLFTVQFNKDMDETSFDGHILLRYAGGVRAGDRPFVGLRFDYDGGRRALSIDPGDVLRPGREVELLLLAGIRDIDGLELLPRVAESGVPEGNSPVIDRLRWWIAR
ncbi:MAG: Ig-like domain-containing protein [Vicinamibacteria bacterium]